MKIPPVSASSYNAETVQIVSISPIAEDHDALKRAFSQLECSSYTTPRWAIHPTTNLKSAFPILRNERVPIVLSECDLCPGTWKDVLKEVLTLPDPPLLIVTSRLADEYLWAEALNLGAHDVLAKPFNNEELLRVLSLAWLRKKRGHGSQTRNPAVKTPAASRT